MKFILFRKLEHIPKRTVSIFFGIIFLMYFITVSLSWGHADAFNKIMMFCALLWIIISVKINFFVSLLNKLPKIFRIFLKVALVSFILSFIIVEVIIIHNMRTSLTGRADYVIVLGCQVDGSIPSIALRRRVNVAVKYLKQYQETNVVVSGGQGPGENISEAAAMKAILIQNGIDEHRIFEEDNAKSTMENFKLSNELYNLSDKNVAVVSSDYHLYRALSMAKKLNYKNVKGLPSKSQLSVLPVYLLREYAAVVYYILRGRI